MDANVEFRSKVKHKTLSGQSREIISCVLQFMQNEAKKGVPVIPLAKVQERVAAATGISLRTVKTIAGESRKIECGGSTSFSTPKKKLKNRNKKIVLDDFDRCVLRRLVLNFHINEKRVPTMKAIHKKFCSDTEYRGCVDTLRKELHTMGFKWVKTKSDRKLLMERHDIRQMRLNYLRTILRYREENRNIVYMDETYLHSTYTQVKSWTDDSNEGLKKKVTKGQKLIIIHAGGENGFVIGANLTWKSTLSTGDYHDEMNYSNFRKWVEQKLLNGLPPNSVLVMDNAPYHNKQTEKCPTSNSRKDDMKDWLTKKNIQFENSMLKPDLYTLIKLYKPKYKTYEIDELLHNHGHSVLRLPPYHPDLNPIELVWASLKEYVAKRNVTFNFNDVNNYCNDFFESFSKDDWLSRCRHVIKIEREYWEKEQLFDTVVDDIIINLGEDSEEESEKENSDTDSDISGVHFNT